MGLYSAGISGEHCGERTALNRGAGELPGNDWQKRAGNERPRCSPMPTAVTPPVRPAGASPGLYRIAGDGDGLLYVGESDDVGKRLKAHRGRDWITPAPLVSVWSAPTDTRKHQLHELENDLIGDHVHVARRPPAYQFGQQTEGGLSTAFPSN
jgi:hypothetical protein